MASSCRQSLLYYQTGKSIPASASNVEFALPPGIYSIWSKHTLFAVSTWMLRLLVSMQMTCNSRYLDRGDDKMSLSVGRWWCRCFNWNDFIDGNCINVLTITPDCKLFPTAVTWNSCYLPFSRTLYISSKAQRDYNHWKQSSVVSNECILFLYACNM